MLGWLRRRRLKEQRMLLYQNSSASEGSLAGYFSRDPHVSARLEAIAAENRDLALSVDGSALLPPDSVNRLLLLNRELRRLYDTTASRYLESFDQVTTPRVGWKWYLANFDEE